MPAIRSPKGKAAARPRQHLQKDNVDPCEICGVVVSRKSDIPRHAKRHASDAEKLPCPWEGCTFRTLQKSNLDTHYRRHTQDRSYNCTDDPDSCKFQTCDPASLLRHRKRLHGYTPRATVGYKDQKPHKHVHIRVIRGIEAEPGSVASQFSTFPSGASTSGSSSSAIASRPLSPPGSLSPSSTPSPSPSPSPPPPSRSHMRPRLRSFSPPNSSGESEISSPLSPSPPTPIASTSDREMTPERPSPERSSPTVLSMTSSPVYPTGKCLLFPDSPLLLHTAKNYAWGLSLVDAPLTTPELLDGSAYSSPGSELLEFRYSEEEMDDDGQPLSVGDESDVLRLPLGLPNMEKVWPGYETAGQLIGSEGLELDKRSCKTIVTTVENQVTFGMSIDGNPLIQPHNWPVGFFRNSAIDLEGYQCKLEPLDLEIGFECGGELAVSSTTLDVDANSALVVVCYDEMAADQTTLVDSTASTAGDQGIETIANATTITDVGNVDDNMSSHASSNHLYLSRWDIVPERSVVKDDLDGGGDVDLLIMLFHT